MSDMVTTYEPDNSLKRGYISLFMEIWNELKTNRWLMYQLFKRDFLAAYKQSFIGIFWAFLIPLVSIGTFIILNNSKVFAAGEIDVPYPLYAVLGLTFWQIFAVGLLASTNALVNAGPMIVKINFSKKALVVASVGQAFVSFSLQFTVVCLLFLVYHIMPSIMILLVPLFVLPIILLTLGLGLILALVNGVMRDIGNVISVVMTFCMFLTPVFYAPPTTGTLANVTRYNMLYYLVSIPRELLLRGESENWVGFCMASLLSCLIFVICLMAFHLTETRVTERI